MSLPHPPTSSTSSRGAAKHASSSATPIDSVLETRVRQDLHIFRRRRAIFSLLSIVLIVAELFFSISLFFASVNDEFEVILSLSAIQAFLVSVDLTFGIRERASLNHVMLVQMRGVLHQIHYPETSLLWQEYSTISSSKKINYCDAVFDLCAPPPVELPDQEIR